MELSYDALSRSSTGFIVTWPLNSSQHNFLFGTSFPQVGLGVSEIARCPECQVCHLAWLSQKDSLAAADVPQDESETNLSAGFRTRRGYYIQGSLGGFSLRHRICDWHDPCLGERQALAGWGLPDWGILIFSSLWGLKMGGVAG